jgi:hypothetical protein
MGGVEILVSGASPNAVPHLIRSFSWQTSHLIKEIKGYGLHPPEATGESFGPPPAS